jgi:hypothetical protein
MDVTAKSETDRDTLRFAMNLSLAVSLLMFVMKTGAYLLTGSAAILSDAAESVTHLAAVFFAAYSLRLSYRPTPAGEYQANARPLGESSRKSLVSSRPAKASNHRGPRNRPAAGLAFAPRESL